MTRLSVVFILFLFQHLTCGAQEFSGGFHLGFNAAQIDGDLYSGYNKIGLHGGLGIAYRVDDIWSLESGITYDVLGSQKELQIGSDNPEEQQKISLSYISIPLSAHYTLRSIPLSIGAALQYSYLLDSQIQDRSDDTILEFFKASDIAASLIARYRFSEQWSCSLKISESLNLIFNNDKVPSLNSNSLRNRYLTFSFIRHL